MKSVNMFKHSIETNMPIESLEVEAHDCEFVKDGFKCTDSHGGQSEYIDLVSDNKLIYAGSIDICHWNIFHNLPATGSQVDVFDMALASANKIKNESDRAGALRKVAVAMASAGLFDKAMKTVESIVESNADVLPSEPLEQMALALSDIAVLKGGDHNLFNAAVKTAYRIIRSDCRANALIDIAVAKGGDLEVFREAVYAANSAPKLFKNNYLERVAIAMAEFGMFDEVSNIVAMIDQPHHKVKILIDVAIKKGGDAELFEEAIKTVALCELSRDEKYREIATAMAKTGLYSDAIATIENIEDKRDQSGALHDIALAMARDKLFDDAVDVTDMIEDMKLRSCALRSIAVLKGGDKKLFAKSIKAAKEIDGALDKARALMEIAVAKGNDAKLFLMAVKTLKKEKYDEDGVRSSLYGEIAVAMAKAGLFGKAIKIVAVIDYPQAYACALADIALAKGGDGKLFDKAVKAANNMGSDLYKSSALEYISYRMAKSGMYDKAVKTASMIERPIYRAKAFTNIAGLKGGDSTLLEEAIKDAKKIEFTDFQIEALINIAAMLRSDVKAPCPTVKPYTSNK